MGLLWAIDWFVDRCRTTNNMMGDCYCAAVVEALSRKELDAMDQLNEKLRAEEEEKLMGPTLGMHKSPSTSSNGSRVAVPEEVIVVENSTDEEDEETKALNPLPIV